MDLPSDPRRCVFMVALDSRGAHDQLSSGRGFRLEAGIGGTTLIQAFVDGDTDRAPLTIGVLLMMCSGIAVVGIGLLMYPVLKTVNPRLAVWCPALRIIELTVSAACGLYLLARSEVVPNHLLWVYIPTGIGGLILTYLLFVSRLVPRPIAVLGLVGYTSLAFSTWVRDQDRSSSSPVACSRP